MLQTSLPANIDLIVPVPAAPQRFRQRGYNPAQLLARELARELHLPLVDALAHLGNQRQVGAGRTQRLAQAEQAFAVAKSNPIVGARVLLVDDVVTTGATLSACAGALKAVGAKTVWAAVAVAKH